jgi:DNA-binding response OmpR family regulator
MPDVLIASDGDRVHREIESVLAGPDTTIRRVHRGADVLPAVVERTPDLLVVDMQIGNMGAFAVTLDLRLEEGAGRAEAVPILVLLDRRADVFLARRSTAEGWLVKPLDPIRLRRAAKALLEGGTYHDNSYLPEPVVVPALSGTVEDSGK